MTDGQEKLIANRLREVRRAQGLALWGLAARAKASPAMLSAVEHHGYVPSAPVRERIATALGVAVADIWPNPDDRPGNVP